MNRKQLIDKVIINCAYFYIMIPIVIFLCGWCYWYIAIPGTIVFIVAFISICKNNKPIYSFNWSKKELIKFLLVCGIIAIWVYLSGIGSYVFQNTDHLWRNAIFEFLVDFEWPVVGEVLVDGELKTRGLVYYIGFWLTAAVIGKIGGMEIGYFSQYVWAVLGIVLFYYLVCVVRKKIEVWPLLIFVFMSGLDIVGYLFLGNDLALLDGTSHIEWWSTYQFSCFTTQLFWVFNQALPAWIIFMLMYLQKNNRYIVLILGCALLSSTLPFIGMIPFFVYFTCFRKYENCKWGKGDWWKNFFKDTFTFENILGGGIAGIISFIYLSGNLAGQNIEADYGGVDIQEKLMLILVFLFMEAGVYWLIIYKYQKNNPLFYIMVAWLCLCPWIQVGHAKDFCMRASIPALVVLYLMIVETIEKSFENKKYLRVCLLVILLCAGSVTAKNEIQRTVVNTYNDGANGGKVPDEEIFNGSNFAGDIKESMFFKYRTK